MYCLVFSLLMFSCGTTKDVNLDDETIHNPDWTFEVIAAIIHQEFPEAYDNFINISYSRVEMSVTPEKASFLIPTKYFENKLNGYREGCHEVEIGESKEYAWHSWEDKVVTKVTIYFAIGC